MKTLLGKGLNAFGNVDSYLIIQRTCRWLPTGQGCSVSFQAHSTGGLLPYLFLLFTEKL